MWASSPFGGKLFCLVRGKRPEPGRSVMVQGELEIGESVGSEPTESRLRLHTIIRLRWFGGSGQLLALVIVYLAFGFRFPYGYCLIFIAISAWVNVFLKLRYPGRHRLNPLFAAVLLAYDTLQLIALLYLTGGIENPFVDADHRPGDGLRGDTAAALYDLTRHLRTRRYGPAVHSRGPGRCPGIPARPWRCRRSTSSGCSLPSAHRRSFSPSTLAPFEGVASDVGCTYGKPSWSWHASRSSMPSTDLRPPRPTNLAPPLATIVLVTKEL